MATYVIYSNPGDGEVYGANPSYSTARSGAGSLTQRTAYSLIGQYLFSGTYYVHETFLSFDTSAVYGVPSSVTLSVKDRTNATTQDFTVNARAKDWGATLGTEDFIAGANLSANALRATFATSGISGSGYLDFTSEATFKDNLASPVRLVLSSSRTESGTTPTVDEYWSIYPADTSGTTDDPKLTIVASGGNSASDTLSAADSASVTEAVGEKSASDTASAADTAGVSVAIPGAASAGPDDEFAGTADTLVTSHTSDSSHAWESISGNTVPKLNGSGALKPNGSGGGNSAALITYTPPSADYTLTAGLRIASGAVTDSLVGTLARSNDTISGSGGYLHPYLYNDAGTVYLGLYNGATTYFYGTVASVLGSYTAGNVYDVAVVLSGSTVTLTINGTTAWTGTISGPLTAGKVGARLVDGVGMDTTITYLTVSGVSGASGGADTVTLTEGTASITDPSTVAKTASDTFTATDAYTGLLAKIDPQNGSWSQAAWATRAPHAGAVLVKDGGTGINSFPFGVQLPNGTLRVYYNQEVFHIGWKDSTDGGATWTGASTTYKFWGDLPSGQGGGFTNIRRGPSGRLHASISKFRFGGTWETTYPGGTGWTIHYDAYYSYSDDGSTWSSPVQVFYEAPGGGETDLDIGSFTPMDVCELPNGDILFTGDYYEHVDYMTSAGNLLATRLYRSTDGGASFTYENDIISPATWGGVTSEFQIAHFDDGSTDGILIGTVADYSTGDPPTRRVLRSTDNGATWNTSLASLGVSVNRGGLCVMPDGDIVITAATSHGTGSPVWWVSRDQGITYTNMGSLLSGTTQPSAGGTGSYTGNKWITPFVIAVAGTTPNLGVCWGSGYDDAHGSTFFRSFTRGATAAPVIAPGQAMETATVADSTGVTVSVGAITKTASDSFTATDTLGGVVVTLTTATDAVTVTDAASLASVDTITASDAVAVIESFVSAFEVVGSSIVVHPQGMVPGTAISAYLRWEWKGPVAAKLNAGPGAAVRTTTVADDLTVTFVALNPGEYVAYSAAYPTKRLFFMVTE